MTHLIFVYGTLKEGCANFHINTGRRVGGAYVTRERFPLCILGDYRIPWLVDRPGEGEHIVGQLFEVDAEGLARMDRLERLGEPGWYTRRPIEVREHPHLAGRTVEALVYFGAAERPGREVVHAEGLQEFLPEHDAMYRRSA